MARKRKLDSKSAETAEPPKKQQQQEEPPKEEPQEEVEEEEEEEYEEVEEEEEDNEDDPDGETNQSAQISAFENQNDDDDEDEDEEPIEKLLEPFGKDQLINLLREAADGHRDVADQIRQVADRDPVHRKIFVHGLGWDTNAEALMNAFKCYGEIEDCKAVCDKVSGKSKGYGFILFKKRSGARNALKEPQKKIGNRMAACQLASIGPVPQSSAGPFGPIAAAQTQQQVSEYTLRKIYVSNVGADLDPQKLVSFFSEFGEIEEGPLGLDKATGKPKGFCLFVYKTAESAKKALEEPHKSFEGHILHCQRAVDGPKHAKSQKPPPQHHNMQSSHYQRNDGGGYVASGGRGGHLMAPAAAGAGIGYNQSAAAPALNPALGQALTALLATQGAGLGGLTNLLGTLGSAAAVTQGGVPSAGHGMQGAYGNQASISPGVIGAYANQGTMQGGYPNQQMGQGGSGRGQHGQYNPYMGH